MTELSKIEKLIVDVYSEMSDYMDTFDGFVKSFYMEENFFKCELEDDRGNTVVICGYNEKNPLILIRVVNSELEEKTIFASSQKEIIETIYGNLYFDIYEWETGEGILISTISYMDIWRYKKNGIDFHHICDELI